MTKALRRALGALLGAFVRLWLATLRLTLVIDPALGSAARPGSSSPAASPASGRTAPWVLALWHGQQMLLLRWIRRRSTVVLVSLSDDGELLAGALPVLGYDVERGSSSRGGARGLRGAVRSLRAGSDAAFAVDGPKGPRRIVRTRGAAIAARMAGGVVVPMAAACSSRWVLSRTWDHFELPRPFSRVAIVLGAPLPPDDADPALIAAAIERARSAAEIVINRGAAELPAAIEASKEGAAPEVLP
jgi:lysophospholipid acyltransferase (LPLAT)-like uncharacterized protein